MEIIFVGLVAVYTHEKPFSIFIKITIAFSSESYSSDQKFSYMPLQKQPPKVFLGKGVLNICSKFTEEHPCRSAISIKCKALRHGCSPVNLLHIFRASFPNNTSGGLLLPLAGPQFFFHKIQTISSQISIILHKKDKIIRMKNYIE